jgi:hypothetical protein
MLAPAGGRLVFERRGDEPWREYVDPNGGRNIPGERATEAQDRALGDRVEDRVLPGHALGHVIPRHVDDHPTAGLAAHEVDCRPRGQHGPANVHPEQEVQLLERGEASARAGEDVRAGVVDPDIDAAVGAAEVGRERLELALYRDVEPPHLDPAAEPSDEGSRLLRSAGIVAVGDCDLGTRPCAGDCDGASDPTRPAGHEHDLRRQAPVCTRPALPLLPHAASRFAGPWARLLNANIPLP